MNKPFDFSYLVTQFFSKFLIEQKGYGENTVKSYADAFSLLLKFLSEHKKFSLQNMQIKDISADVVEDFLLWLSNERKNSISTRNQRLAAIHSFFKYVQFERPDLLLQCHKILAIESKTAPKPITKHLSEREMGAILSKPNVEQKMGRRDAAILSLLYDSGARVSELVGIKMRDLRLQNPCTVKLMGKRRKFRTVSLINKTVLILKSYIEEYDLAGIEKHDFPLFFNSRGSHLTRQGISFIVKKYVDISIAQGDIALVKVTPHVFRHTKAMHLIKCGENIFHIRDVLGHNDVATTEIYAKIGIDEKKAAFEKANENLFPEIPSWKKDGDLGAWLKNLCTSE